ncbi:sensor histidine kinase [Halocella sp. SP3-1]|uniref:sensor histidine kinase n=1 Tax=Halocella sp. SP3-1 TaxID=2382161 RepID=UPI000F759723|nr:sensor histidine kinase [Halocella sp. SP3-1]AZO94347.1 sensor histidine kinase [Halocella sp. SP3-1]
MFERFKKIHRKYKLRYKMIFVNLLISILPIILIALIFYNIFLNNIEKYVSDSVDLYFNQVNHRLEEYLDTVNIIADSVFFDKKLQELIISKDKNYWDKYNEIDLLFQSFLKFYESVEDIYVIDNNHNIYHSKSIVFRDEFKNFIINIDSAKINDGKLYFADPLKTKGGDLYFIAYRVIKSMFFENFMENIARGAVILDAKKIEKIIEENNLPEGSHVFIQNNAGEVITVTRDETVDIYRSSQADLNSNKKYININGVTYMQRTSELNKVGWTIKALINRDKLVKEGRVVQYIIILIALIVFVFVVITTLVFNYRLTFPLKKMADAFDRVATGDFNYQLKFKYKNEITNIEDNFNNMLRELEGLTKNLLDTQEKAHLIELEKKQFQLDGLQAQINAHFLYNTLNTIRVMALTGAKKEMDRMISNLVDYLRYISKVHEFVSLEEELEQLNKYKNIENLRFANKFKVKYRIESGLERLKILKLTVQPVLENAIFHGLRQISGNGVIQISAFQKGDKALIRVMDNGTGIKKRELEQIKLGIQKQDIVTDSSKGSDIGIGLVNIHKRIQLYYGNDFGLEVKSWEDIGTVVTISYPYRKGKEEDV